MSSQIYRMNHYKAAYELIYMVRYPLSKCKYYLS